MTPAEISGLLAAFAAVLGAITVLVRYGLTDKGDASIKRAENVQKMLDAALTTLNRDLERKDRRIEELEADCDAFKEERRDDRRTIDRLRGALRQHGVTDPTAH